MFNCFVHWSCKINCLDFSHKIIVTAGSDGTVAILDFASGTLLQYLQKLHSGIVNNVLIKCDR